ncbi:hypothetical protein KBD81_01040 [Candidatus Woesebacteria bacterium]|nr:hypothetical protein [Candidatus Woesebacteria bacterium]
MRAENFSPLDPIKAALSSPPGTEAAACLTLPVEISLFEKDSADADVVLARQDHDRMRESLEENGIRSYNMRDIIGTELARRYSLAVTSREAFLEELVRRAFKLQEIYHLVPDFDHLVEEMYTLFDQDAQNMGLDPAIAINGVLTNILDHRGSYKEFNPDLPPAGNFMFWRDTNHVIGDEMVTHRMFTPIRQQEIVLAHMGFEALGLEYAAIQLDSLEGSIEGGDILPLELDGQRYALIGTAERTSYNAVEAWFSMHERLFSQSGEGMIPIVVKGPTTDTQNQMHLDTFVQQIAPGAVIHCGEITRNRDISILLRRGGRIVQVDPGAFSHANFADWIEQKADSTYDMSREDQLRYAPNVLVHGSATRDTTVFVTRDGTPKVTDFIQQHAMNTVLLGMNELTKFYGGAHCATSEIR